MISVCEHEKTMKMQKPSKTHANIIKSELTRSAYLNVLGPLCDPSGTLGSPMRGPGSSIGVPWEPLSADLEPKRTQKELQECSKLQNGDPSNSLEKPSKYQLLMSWGASWELLGRSRRHQRRLHDTLWPHFGDVEEPRMSVKSFQNRVWILVWSFM